ncbi:MAG: GNAT family N-acetyltransferase [Alphaproteobacteria bacterium]|nr:GNAT family N-acetyltransferase [Alphaproteobacteria bacterium]
MYPSRIIGRNIELKILPATEENAEKVYYVIQNNKEYLSQFFQRLVSAFDNKKQALDILKFDEEQRWLNNSVNYYIFSKNQLIGEIAADWSRQNSRASIIYWLDKSHVGKGYMSQALKMMEKNLFLNGYSETRLYIDAANWRSVNVAKYNYYQLSDDGNYYFKTRQMYNNPRQPICHKQDYIGRFCRLFRTRNR